MFLGSEWPGLPQLCKPKPISMTPEVAFPSPFEDPNLIAMKYAHAEFVRWKLDAVHLQRTAGYSIPSSGYFDVAFVQPMGHYAISGPQKKEAPMLWEHAERCLGSICVNRFSAFGWQMHARIPRGLDLDVLPDVDVDLFLPLLGVSHMSVPSSSKRDEILARFESNQNQVFMDLASCLILYIAVLWVFTACLIVDGTAFIRQFLTRCLLRILWVIFLLSLAMVVWSVLALQLLRPMIGDVAAAGVYPRWREEAFSSVMATNCFWCQVFCCEEWSIVAGSLIEHKPWTSMIFFGAMFTLSLALLNVFIVCMVESVPPRGVAWRTVVEREEAMEQAQFLLLQVVEVNLDCDLSGEITVQEVKRAADEVNEFKDFLTVMDIVPDDIKCVLCIYNGVVTYDGDRKSVV